MKSLGVRRLGFESAVLTVADWGQPPQSLARCCSWWPTAEQVESSAVRSRTRRRSPPPGMQSTTPSRALSRRSRCAFEPGLTEKKVADLLEATMRQCGATGSSFPPIVAVGAQVLLCPTRGRPSSANR